MFFNKTKIKIYISKQSIQVLWTAFSFFQCCHKIICDNLGKLQNNRNFLLENIGSIVPNIYYPDSKMKKGIGILTTSRLQIQPKRYKMLPACNLRPLDPSSLGPCHIVYSNNSSNKRRGLLWAWRWQTAVQPPHRLRTPQTPQQAAERERRAIMTHKQVEILGKILFKT